VSPSPPRAPAAPEAQAVACSNPDGAHEAHAAGSEHAVAGLLRDLGAQLQRGSSVLARQGVGIASGARLATGLPDIDALIGGGLPPGRLSEIAGPTSSGRTSVALALLARATRRGHVAAWIDVAQAFDAGSAAAAGAVLGRVLWARPPALHEAMRCCECLLGADGFALVVLDPGCACAEVQALPTSTWQRLARKAAGSDTALVVLSRTRSTGSFADLVLEMQTPRAHFSGTPALLEGLSIEARVARHRTGPALRVASVRLSTESAA